MGAYGNITCGWCLANYDETLEHSCEQGQLRERIEELQAKVEELDNFIELVEDALGCTDGDDIRAHIKPELAALKEKGHE